MLPGRRRICGPSFSLDSLQLEHRDAMAQDLWGQAPLGKSGVHRITRCLSLLSALRRSVCKYLPFFQGAAVSSEHFSQSLPPKNVAELGCSPPLQGSLEQLDRPSPAGPPLQGTELATLSTPEASLERSLVGPEQALVMEQEVTNLELPQWENCMPWSWDSGCGSPVLIQLIAHLVQCWSSCRPFSLQG